MNKLHEAIQQIKEVEGWQMADKEERMMLTLFMSPSTSTGQGSGIILKSKTGRLFFGKPSKSAGAKWKKLLCQILKQFATHDGLRYKASECVRCTIDVVFPHNKGTPRSKRRSCYRRNKPDLDNYAKLVLDAIVEAGLISDDRFIVQLNLAKYNANIPSLSISLENIDQTEGENILVVGQLVADEIIP